jgi:hypothetical protein
MGKWTPSRTAPARSARRNVSRKLFAGQAAVEDPAVRRLISPEVLPALSDLPLRDRYVAATWVQDVPVAAASARIHRDRRSAEIVSLATLTEFRESTALATALRHLCGALTGTGLTVVFDPVEPTTEHVTRNLGLGGLTAARSHWIWFQFDAESVARVRASSTFAALPDVRMLSELDREQRERLIRHGSYSPHTDDLESICPVAVDDDGRPIAAVVLRKGSRGPVLHWAWVDPASRRRGLVLAITDRMFATLEEADINGNEPRFRVESENADCLHVVERPPVSTAVRRLFTTRTWTSMPRR